MSWEDAEAQEVEVIRRRLHDLAERIRQRAAEGRPPRRAAPAAPRVLPRPRVEASERIRHWTDVGEDEEAGR
ncbi:MAG: hypothetical protein QM767_27345 [Anaeromyxobacter sp.]